jgi:outer membrane protein assembly factor BamB
MSLNNMRVTAAVVLAAVLVGAGVPVSMRLLGADSAPVRSPATATAGAVTSPTVELIQRLRSEFDGSLPKDLRFGSLQIIGDYLYAAGAGAIHYFKRDPQTGKLSYVGAVPWITEKGRIQSLCAVGGRLYANTPFEMEANWHGVVWYEIEPVTGKPVEKGRATCTNEKDHPVGTMLAAPDGKGIYVTIWSQAAANRLGGFNIAADGKPVYCNEAMGKGFGGNMRISPDGKHIYTIGSDHHIACFERQSNGEITHKKAFPLESVTPGPGGGYYWQEVNLAGMSPDGKWLYAVLFRNMDNHGELKDWYNDERRKSFFAIFKRDPATGDLTLQEAGSSHDSTREDFKLASYRGLNLIFLPGGGFIVNAVDVLQTFRCDPATGRLSDISDVVLGGKCDSYCDPGAPVAFDPPNGFLYGTGIWCHGGYEDYRPEMWAAKTGTAQVRGGGRLDILATTAAAADAKPGNDVDWPRWHGPNGDSKNPTKGIRKDWTGGLKKVWEVSGLSPSHSTWSEPVVQGNRLVVVGKHGYLDEVFCFDADKGGAPLWIAELEGGSGRDGWCGGPTPTPTISGDRVYLYQNAKYVCVSLTDGKVLWKKSCFSVGHGPGHPPLVWNDLVIFPNIFDEKKDKRYHLAAMNKDTGELVWTYEDNSKRSGTTYLGPVTMQLNGKEQIVYTADRYACGLEPRTGKALWEHVLEPPQDSYGRVMSDPASDGSTLVVALAVGTRENDVQVHDCALQIENGKARQLWMAEHAPGWSTPVIMGGYLYAFNANGLYSDGNSDFRCVDMKTGRTKWVEKKTGCGSIVEVDGCLLCLTYTGDLWLLEPSPDGFKKITEWKGAIPPRPWWSMGGLDLKHPAPCWTVPTIARDKIYLRASDTLTCYDLMSK